MTLTASLRRPTPQTGHSIAVAALLALCANAVQAQPSEVKVEMRGDTVVVDVEAIAAVEPRFAWAVLTDYDHMSGYVSVLKTSKILKRVGNHWQVEQVGEAKKAFMKFNFRSLRAVDTVVVVSVVAAVAGFLNGGRTCEAARPDPPPASDRSHDGEISRPRF